MGGWFVGRGGKDMASGVMRGRARGQQGESSDGETEDERNGLQADVANRGKEDS